MGRETISVRRRMRRETVREPGDGEGILLVLVNGQETIRVPGDGEGE